MASETNAAGATGAADTAAGVDYSQLAQEVLQLMPTFRHPPHPDGGDRCAHDHGPLRTHGEAPARPPCPADLRDASRGAPIVLALLSREGGGATPSRLCELSGLSKGRVSNIVSSLESKDYVQKQPSPEDARSVTVTLTPKGRAFTSAHEQAMLNHVAAILEKLGPRDARDAVRVLKHLAEIMEGGAR